MSVNNQNHTWTTNHMQMRPNGCGQEQPSTGDDQAWVGAHKPGSQQGCTQSSNGNNKVQGEHRGTNECREDECVQGKLYEQAQGERGGEWMSAGRYKCSRAVVGYVPFVPHPPPPIPLPHSPLITIFFIFHNYFKYFTYFYVSNTVFRLFQWKIMVGTKGTRVFKPHRENYGLICTHTQHGYGAGKPDPQVTCFES